MSQQPVWRLNMGSSVLPEGVRFRVWAPRASCVDVVIVDPPDGGFPMQRDANGVWEVTLSVDGPGTRYGYRLDNRGPFPDPYSRSQPQGVHGPSEVVDPLAYVWHDQDWTGIDRRRLVIYECHIGTMTPEGTCEALIEQLPRLQALGVNALELMPVAACSGRRNWGYDGVGLFAVSASYGGPEALRCLVDAAHQHALGVLLDVVYNHLGPEGNYLGEFAPEYFSRDHRTPWGEAPNYDDVDSQWVRQWAIDNACYWLHEYHLDGLRLDSTSSISDRSPIHFLQEFTQTVRASLESTRPVALIAETSSNDARYLQQPAAGGYGFDAVWADDFSWSLLRYLTGDDEGRYQDYKGTLEEVARTINQGFLYEGEWSAHRRRRRGTPARHQPAWQFQYCLQHHDHVGNRALGERLHHRLDLGRYRAASALLLLLPYMPLLFMGQEFAASSPFQFFTDHSPELGRRVAQGRRQEFAAYSAFADAAAAARIPDPQAATTFDNSRLVLNELACSPGREMQCLYQELLRLRRTDAVLCRQDRQTLSAQVAGSDLLALLWRDDMMSRVLLANFGTATTVSLAALLRQPPTGDWRVCLDTNEQRFGGSGVLTVVSAVTVRLPERLAVFLAAV